MSKKRFIKLCFAVVFGVSLLNLQTAFAAGTRRQCGDPTDESSCQYFPCDDVGVGDCQDDGTGGDNGRGFVPTGRYVETDIGDNRYTRCQIYQNGLGATENSDCVVLCRVGVMNAYGICETGEDGGGGGGGGCTSNCCTSNCSGGGTTSITVRVDCSTRLVTGVLRHGVLPFQVDFSFAGTGITAGNAPNYWLNTQADGAGNYSLALPTLPSPEGNYTVWAAPNGLANIAVDSTNFSCPLPYRLSASTEVPDLQEVGLDYTASVKHRIFNDAANSEGRSRPATATVAVTIKKFNAGTSDAGGFPVTSSVAEIDRGSDVYVEYSAINVGPLVAGDKVCTSITVQPYSTYPGDPASVQSLEQCRPVANKPYFKVIGDLRARDRVRGWNKGVINYRQGASASGSITSLEGINEGVASGVFQQNFPPTSAKNLTFANTNPSAEYGGAFFAPLDILSQPSDFYDAAPSPAAPLSGVVSIPAVSGVSVYTTSGDITLESSSLVAGQKTTLYVSGNVTIQGNLTYANAGGYASAKDIPSLRIITRGNIYIAPSVTQLDGFFVAGGYFYTCHDGIWAVPLSNSGVSALPDLFTLCSQPLVINGAVVAGSIKFTRTAGQLRLAAADDGKPTAGSVTNRGNVAESIIAGPELYLSIPAGTSYRSVGSRIDTFTALPPFF